MFSTNDDSDSRVTQIKHDFILSNGFAIIGKSFELVSLKRSDMGAIYKSEFTNIVYLPTKKMLIAKWTKECDNFMDEQYNREAMRVVEISKQYEVISMMIDIIDCSYFSNGGSNTWFKNTIYGFFKDVKAKKVAIIVPQNLLVHASFDATRESLENGIKNAVVQYFRDEQKALKWLG